jgi:hypothetical protein
MLIACARRTRMVLRKRRPLRSSFKKLTKRMIRRKDRIETYKVSKILFKRKLIFIPINLIYISKEISKIIDTQLHP